MTDTGSDARELVDVEVPRVDAVEDPAHGRPFLVVKSRGVPFAMRKMAGAPIVNGKYDAAALRAMGAKGHAFRNDDGSFSYPIGDTEDLSNAIRAVGRGSAPHDALRRYIMGRADDLGAKGKIPDSWSSTGKVEKEMADSTPTPSPEVPDSAGAVDPTVDGHAPDAAAMIPGSPAWEAEDASRGALAAGKLAWLRGVVGALKDREAAEGGEDLLGHVQDLDSVVAALDYAVGVMGKFAVDEAAEGDAVAAEAAVEVADPDMPGPVAKSSDVEDGVPPVAVADSDAPAPPPAAPEPPAPAPGPAPDYAPPSTPGPVEKARRGSVCKEDAGPIHAAMSVLADQCGCPACHGFGATSDALAGQAAYGDTVKSPAGPELDVVEADMGPAPVEEAASPAAAVPDPVDGQKASSPDTDMEDTPDVAVVRKSAPEVEAASTAAIVEAVVKALGGQFDVLARRITELEEAPLPGGPLLNGQRPPVDAAEPSADPYTTIRKGLDAIGDPDARARAAQEVSFDVMRAIMAQRG